MVTLALVLGNPTVEACTPLSTLVFDLLALISDGLTLETRLHCIQIMHGQHHLQDARLNFLLGFPGHGENNSLRLMTGDSGLRSVPFSSRRFEMVQDATPTMGFNARKAT